MASRSPACAAIPTTRRTSASCAPRAATLHLTARPALREVARAPPGVAARRAEQRRARVSWDEALDHVADRFAAIVAAHGPDAVGVLRVRAAADRGLSTSSTSSRKASDRHQQHRHQLAPVHVVSAVAGYKPTLGADAPPACYEDVDHARPGLHRRLEHGLVAHPVLLPPARSCARATQPGHEADRRRPASHRHRARGRPAPRDRAGHRRRALPRHAAPAALGRALSTRLHRARTPRASTRCAKPSASTRRRTAAGICGIAERDLVQAARWFGEAGAALSLYCQGLNQSTSGTPRTRR